MNERLVITQGDDGPIVESLWRGAAHPGQRECPGCHASTDRIAIIKLMYVFRDCSCDQSNYTHLVEQTWHPTCFVAALAETGEATGRHVHRWLQRGSDLLDDAAAPHVCDCGAIR